MAQHYAGDFLGSRQLTASLSTATQVFPNPYGTGKWSAIFDPRVLGFSSNLVECYHIALNGPSGSALQLFIDGTFYDTTPQGAINSYDPTHPLLLRGGQALCFHWNSGATPAGFVTTWWRMPIFGGGG